LTPYQSAVDLHSKKGERFSMAGVTIVERMKKIFFEAK
jgi:hypothetical protein